MRTHKLLLTVTLILCSILIFNLACENETVVPVSEVSLNKSTLTMEINDSETLTATLTPSDATDKTVSWTSNNTSVATVDSNGKVTAQSAGTAIITVTTQDGNKTAHCTVTVREMIYSGNPIDADGNEYETVIIGEQVWFAENLKTTKYNDGSSISNVTSDSEWYNLTSPAYCWYDNDEATYKEQYGALYNWYTVDTSSNVNRNICPEGWHVPSDDEWTQLKEYLIASGYNWDGTTNGNKIGKSLASTSGWFSSSDEGDVGNNQSSNNSSGFNLYPVATATQTVRSAAVAATATGGAVRRRVASTRGTAACTTTTAASTATSTVRLMALAFVASGMIDYFYPELVEG